MFLDDGSSLLSGFDFSGKWFPFSTGSEVTLTADRTMISSYSTWSPYLLGGYRMRDYTFEDTRNSYSGFSYGIGANWFLGKYFEIPLIDRLFTSFEASMAHFKSGPSKRLQTTNIGIGVGTSI